MEDNKLIKERKEKLEKIKELGINPYPYTFDKKDNSADIIKKHENLQAEEKSESKVSVAGRIMQMRKMGKAAFVHIQDETGKIQFYIRKDEVSEEEFKLFKLLDIGDIIGISGTIFKTRTGEITIHAKTLTLLSKSLRPLPEKYHGIKDEELRYRHKELDLIMNPDAKDKLLKRAKILSAVREFLEKKGFIEMTTPILQTQYGGANARPFITKINAWDMPMYLKISPELFLKRLLVGGFEKVYDMNYNFRNEGVDKTHNPEFYMLEFYQAYADREVVMQLTEELWCYVAQKINGSTKFNFEGNEIDVKGPWKRLKILDAVNEELKTNFDQLDETEIKNLLRNYNIEYEVDYSKGMALELLFEHLVEPKLIQPTHVLDHPIESTPLCKETKYNPNFVERVEPYIGGFEIGNGYSELNDPILQRKLLEDQDKKGRGGDEEAHPMDENFLHAIETGMPCAGGMGIGIERMIMLITGAESIREILPFPIMKPKEEEK